MNSEFGKGSGPVSNRSEKDRILFVAAALLALSLVVIFIMVVDVKNSSAKQDVQPTTPAPMNIGTVTLFAPERPINSGTKLNGLKFREVYWPRNQVPDGAVLNINEVLPLYAKTNLQPGVPLTRDQLVSEPDYVVLPVTPGQRAVTIEVDRVAGVEAWAQPGVRVDVVLTSRQGGEVNSKIVVKNARIISLGGSKEARGAAGKYASTGRFTLTLDVPVEDALRITTARELGNLALLMRDIVDNKDPVKDEIRASELDNQGKPSVAKPQRCQGGRMRMDGKDYVICDGRPVPVENGVEP